VQLKSYYELGFIEEILYQLDSYRHTMQIDTVSPPNAKERFLGFLLFVNKLAKLRLSGKAERPDIDAIIKELKSFGSAYEKPWLEEKLEQLKG